MPAMIRLRIGPVAGTPFFCGLSDDEFLLHEFKNHLAE
jgi:hypothetical protein